MKRFLFIIASLVFFFLSVQARAQHDTLRVSTRFTTHVIFTTDITYADASDLRSITAKVVEQNKNMVALKARGPFSEPCSISTLESNGKMWTFIVVYEDSPRELIVDTRVAKVRPSAPAADAPSGDPSAPAKKKGRKVKAAGSASGSGPSAPVASTWKSGNAPMLDEVCAMKGVLCHIGTTGYGLEARCENIFAYSDITYMTFSIDNRSGISYDITDATFVIESRRQSKRTVAYDQTIFPRSRYGSLSAGPGEKGRIVYSFDKMTLSKDQVLRVYLYESGGQRNLVMTVSPSDINKARNIRN